MTVLSRAEVPAPACPWSAATSSTTPSATSSAAPSSTPSGTSSSTPPATSSAALCSIPPRSLVAVAACVTPGETRLECCGVRRLGRVGVVRGTHGGRARWAYDAPPWGVCVANLTQLIKETMTHIAFELAILVIPPLFIVCCRAQQVGGVHTTLPCKTVAWVKRGAVCTRLVSP